MIRKMITAAVAVAALMLSVLALNASAVATCPYNLAQIPGYCAAPAVYTGPFTAMPAGPSGPYGFGTAPNPVPAAATPGTPGVGTPPLAVTGSESTVLGYVGTGLIAFGAVAMGSRRKFLQGSLD